MVSLSAQADSDGILLGSCASSARLQSGLCSCHAPTSKYMSSWYHSLRFGPLSRNTGLNMFNSNWSGNCCLTELSPCYRRVSAAMERILKPRQADFLRQLYGLDGQQPRPASEVAKAAGITTVRVGQVCSLTFIAYTFSNPCQLLCFARSLEQTIHPALRSTGCQLNGEES